MPASGSDDIGCVSKIEVAKPKWLAFAAKEVALIRKSGRSPALV
jgi:hypothetical protein